MRAQRVLRPTPNLFAAKVLLPLDALSAAEDDRPLVLLAGTESLNCAAVSSRN